MHILELYIENIKCIKVVQINPKSNMVYIEGKNNQGKTSVMDSICYALGGKRLIPNEAIRKGEKRACITTKIGDSDCSFLATRTFTEKGSYLKLENEEGSPVRNPQQILDSLIGKLSFDPMQFCRLDNKERDRIFKEVTGISFDDLDFKIDNLWEDLRYSKKRIVEYEYELEKFKGMSSPKNLRCIEEVEEERNEILRYNQSLEDMKYNAERTLEKLSYTKDSIKTLSTRIIEKKKELERLKEELLFLSKEQHQRVIEMEKLEELHQEQLDQLRVDKPKSVHYLTAELNEIMNNNALCRQWATKKDVVDNIKTVKVTIKSIKKRIEECKEQKKFRIKNANFPLDDVYIGDNDIEYNGVEFSQLSSSQKIKISMAIAMQLNPTLKLIRIMDGSLLDNDSMYEIEKIAKEHGFQIWVERVVNSNSNKNAVFIEEGERKDII